MNLRALILCAGLGTRLGSITKDVPKPMLPIGELPCVGYQLLKLQAIGVTEVLINTHKNHECFQDLQKIKALNIKVSLSHEPSLLGPIGTLKTHLEWLAKDNFWLLHGDNFFKDNLNEMLNEVNFSDHRVLGGMGTFRSFNPRSVGIVSVDRNGFFKGIHEKRSVPRGFRANSAIYYFRPNVRSFIATLPNEAISISSHLLPRLKRKLKVVSLDGFFIDIGTIKNLNRARQIVSSYHS